MCTLTFREAFRPERRLLYYYLVRLAQAMLFGGLQWGYKNTRYEDIKLIMHVVAFTSLFCFVQLLLSLILFFFLQLAMAAVMLKFKEIYGILLCVCHCSGVSTAVIVKEGTNNVLFWVTPSNFTAGGALRQHRFDVQDVDSTSKFVDSMSIDVWLFF